jgi:ATP-dependent DNA ligase
MTLLQLEPARAATKSQEVLDKLLDGPDQVSDGWVVEEKLDGWRFLMHFGGDLDRVYMTGRNISTKTQLYSEKGLCVPMLHPSAERLARLKLGYTVLDGEVMPPKGASFRDLAGIMNVAPAKALARIGEIGTPSYHVFDILYYDDRDIRELAQGKRNARARKLLRSLKMPHARVLPHTATHRRMRYDTIVNLGGEGVILKDTNAAYGKGWIKVKRMATLDVIITGYTDALEGVTGKYLGQIGAIIVSVYVGKKLIEVGQVSGMTDADRLKYSTHRRLYIGTVIEIAAQEIAKDRLRHPRFKRERPDVNRKTCTMAKLLGDLK